MYNSAHKPDADKPEDRIAPFPYLHSKRSVGFTGLLMTRESLAVWFKRVEGNGGPFHKYDLNLSNFMGKEVIHIF